MTNSITDHLVEQAGGSNDRLIDILAQYTKDVNTDGRVRYAYEHRRFVGGFDMTELNSMGHAGWEIVQIFRERVNAGPGHDPTARIDTVIDVILKQPWVKTNE